MSRRHDLYLNDILSSIESIQAYRKDFPDMRIGEGNILTDAVIRNLELIGEAVKNLPDSVKEQKPEIQWREIAGFRDVLIHQYFKVNPEIIRDIVQNKLPELEEAVKDLDPEEV